MQLIGCQRLAKRQMILLRVTNPVRRAIPSPRTQSRPSRMRSNLWSGQADKGHVPENTSGPEHMISEVPIEQGA